MFRVCDSGLNLVVLLRAVRYYSSYGILSLSHKNVTSVRTFRCAITKHIFFFDYHCDFPASSSSSLLWVMSSRLMMTSSSKKGSLDASDYIYLALRDSSRLGRCSRWLSMVGLLCVLFLSFRCSASRPFRCWVLNSYQGTTQGLGRHLEFIAMTDPALARSSRLMQVSTCIHVRML